MLKNNEVDELAKIRFRLGKIRRAAVEASKHLETLPSNHPKATEIGNMHRACRSVIAATNPSVVSKATFSECTAVLAFTIAATTCRPRNLN
jgi:hypothetical protein